MPIQEGFNQNVFILSNKSILIGRLVFYLSRVKVEDMSWTELFMPFL